MYNYTASSNEGQAFVTVNRNRAKTYPGNQVFLKDKQEFEIELFNPSSTTKLAKISLDGKLISQAGLVLKPGQRVYLERFIDVPKRFLFETYTVDGSAEALAAVAKNGELEIRFYDEEAPVTYYPHYGSGTFSLNSTGGWGNTCYFSNTSGTGGQSVSSATNSYKEKVRSRAALNSVKMSASSYVDSMDLAEEVETGRVEKGSASDQRFKNYTGSFNYWTTNIVIYKLLPFSAKPLEVSDLAEYCTNCGTKNKKGNYKYCPKCGTKY